MENDDDEETRVRHVDIATQLHAQMYNACATSKRERLNLLCDILSRTHQYRNLLCIQHDGMNDSGLMPKPCSRDHDFDPAFAPSEMRCLALASHNGMKATMKEFVISNRNILKKFRLTGMNSTMTMLKEVFKDENKVVFGPSCASGPLGGDAELVALMCSGRLGGMLFFKDPMDNHPHQCDIDCLCCQAEVHNTMIATTASTALMLLHTLRDALKGEGRPELIPSFFFSLQSPSVSTYKSAQKKVIASHSISIDDSLTTNGDATPRAVEPDNEDESDNFEVVVVKKKKNKMLKGLKKILQVP